MSRKNFKSQASSSRAVSSPFTSATVFNGGGFSTGFGGPPASPLSYIYEPPDLGGIADSAVIVALKNLQKKDSTTKAKALEDLQAFLSSLDKDGPGVEDKLLEAWIRLYPRASIENGRRVRQLAHTIQGQIAVLSGKRIAKYMPEAVGAWLCGLHDSDKLVARSAQEAFEKVFHGKEKQTIVWKAYHTSIIEYCRQAVLKESVQTLSDERTVSPDDAEAKYARVIGTAVLTVVSAIGASSDDELKKHWESYSSFLKEDQLWKFASFPDAFVRRSLYRLLSTTLKDSSLLDFKLISQHVLQGGLHADQTSSAYEFIKTLAKLTEIQPLVWTDYYSGSGKKSATRRLSSFLRKGSQRGPLGLWNQLSALLIAIPISVLRPEEEDRAQEDLQNIQSEGSMVLQALHDGMIRKDDYRVTPDEAWEAYLQLAARLQASTQLTGNAEIAESYIMPIIEQYIRPSAEKSQWTATSGRKVSVEAFLVLLRGSVEIAENLLWQFSTIILRDLKTSLPEQSKDFSKSQDSIISEVERWYRLQTNLLERKEATILQPIFSQTTRSEIETSIQILKNRNGKPYSAAATLDLAVQEFSEVIFQESELTDQIVSFVQGNAPSLMVSASAPYLLRLLDNVNSVTDLQKVYEDCLEKLIDAPEGTNRTRALKTLISSSWPKNQNAKEALEKIVTGGLHSALNGNNDSWTLVNLSLQNSTLPDSLNDEILSVMTDGLSVNQHQSESLYGLETALSHKSEPARSFLASPNGADLMSKLLFLSQVPDNVTMRDQATRLKYQADVLLSNEQYSNVARTTMTEIIRKGIFDLENTALTIDTLLVQAQKILEDGDPENLRDSAENLLPNIDPWRQTLQPYVERLPEESLALTNSLGGAIYLLEQESEPQMHQQGKPRLDRYGMSVCLRMAAFVIKLIESTNLFDLVSTEKQIITCQQLAIFSQITSDHISVPTNPALWGNSNEEDDQDNMLFVADVKSLIDRFLSKRCSENHDCLEAVQENILREAAGISVTSYYNARAYATMRMELREVHGSRLIGSGEDYIGTIRGSQEVLAATAFLTSVSISKAISKLFNELLADLTGRDIKGDMEKGLRELVLFNTVFQALDGNMPDLPPQRLIFFVKHILDAIVSEGMPEALISESLKALMMVFPLIKELYGEFWEDSCNFLIRCLGSAESRLPSLHASLRLCALLRSLAIESINDDLTDCWEEIGGSVSENLVKLLHAQSVLDDSRHQPCRMVNDLLCRQLEDVKNEEIGVSTDLYPVIASDSVALQRAAYSMLHKKIPFEQEQVSLDAALSQDFVAKLPEELLSLMLEAPSPNDYFYLRTEPEMPSALLRYLLSWKLIFDHWSSASYKVQSDYVNNIKEGANLRDLLIFTFDFLIQRRGSKNVVNPSKYDIKDYLPNTAETPENDTQWLLSHLYYLSLKHLPLLTRTWWRSDCPRSLEKQVEDWTEKYISPLIIQDELATVSAWEPNPDATTALEVRVSPRGREVTASYPIDEQTMSMRVSLPASYPLQNALVSTQHRVGVDEKKWSAWLNTTTIAINFSSSSQGLGCVVDGLVAWRKNVSGALKGQSECAICYSVVSADRQLPSKRCGTCKNSFHGSCLFRWFKSSSSSSCPLCRNAFNYA